MKKLFFLLFLIIPYLSLSAKVSAPSLIGRAGGESLLVGESTTEWQEKVDTIWPARHYRELNGEATGDQMTKAWIDWKHPEGTILVYGIHFPTGHVRADAQFKAKIGKKVSFGVRIVHPQTGTVVYEGQATSNITSTTEQTMEILPDTDMPYDGWYRFELTCPNGQSTLDRLNLLLFQRTSTLSITDSEIFMAPSVHLWWSTKVPGAPSGEAYNWTYLEVMYPSAYRRQATYQMSIGADGIYSGIQMPTHSDGSYGHSVLFSVWDNGDVDKDKNLPDILRAAAVDLGPGTYATRFGGEGTGSSIRFNEDNLWKFDHWVQFLYNVRPDIISVTKTDANGKTTTTEYESTLQSMWFKMAEDTEWRYIGTLRMASANRLTSGIYSFLENFANIGGDLMRRCYFRNGAMRSAETGKWYALNHAGYGNTQNNGKRYSRYDFGHGVTDLYDNCFYLETGGYMGKRDSSDTYEPPMPGNMPWVDTIDVARLTQRVDKALTNSQAKTIRSRVENTRVVSNPATWKVTGFSDQETVGEGDYGRAAMILDGNKTTYYHNQWKASVASYPHYFNIDAAEPVSVSSIELYQSRESSYRAKQMTLQVSEDDSRWKNAASNLSVEDTDYPTIQLPEPVTSRYFKLRFSTGYGSNLVINEVYFKHEYRLDDLLNLAKEILDESDQYGGYAPTDVAALRTLYADGTCTDTEALRTAIETIGDTAFPLTYGVVAKAEHFTPLAAYQIHQASGRGDIIVNDNDELSIAASSATNALEAYRQPCSVTNPRCNWLVLRSEKYKDYYLYNLGAKKFLYFNEKEKKVSLSDTPSSFTVSKSGDGFTIQVKGAYITTNGASERPVALTSSAASSTIFQLRTNHALRPEESDVHELIIDAEQAVHEDNNPEYLFQQGLQTYGKAFVTEPKLSSRLLLGSGVLTSNANTTQQEAHNLDKLLDQNTNTYYETWYSGIDWPAEMSYLQARVTMRQNAFYFTFTPSQNAEYGQPDIPMDIVVSAAPSNNQFVTVAHLTEGFPTSIKESYTSPVIFTDSIMRNFRFQVLQTYGNRADSHIFAMSEFQMHPVVFDEAASLYYQKPWVKTAFDALSSQLYKYRSHIANNTVTSEVKIAVRKAIEQAEEALLKTNDIQAPSVAEETEGQSQLYDLLGRQLQKQQKTPAGLYLQKQGAHTRKVIR